MADKPDILGSLLNDPLFTKAAKETDDMLGTDVSSLPQKHAEKIAQAQDQGSKEELLRSFMPETPGPHTTDLLNTPNQDFVVPNPSERSRAHTQQLLGAIKNIDAIVDHSKDWAKPYGFNTGVDDVDYDRYYYHPEFKKLGYSPFRDNETLYNQNSSWWEDFNRMRSQWTGLAGEGFSSMVEQWKNPIDFSPNTDMARSFERRMGIMASSRGGFGGSAINFMGNTAYTVGVLGEMVAEEAVLAGATALTGGFSSEVTVPGMFQTAARAIRGLTGAADLAKSINRGLKSTVGAFQSVKSADRARELWTGVRNASGKTLNFLNPFKNTAEFLSDVSKAGRGEKAVGDLAFLSRGVGSFYKDVRMINAAFSEARLEGGSVKNDLIKELTAKYYQENGKLPEGADAQRITEAATNAGVKDALINIPMIYYTNDIVFGKAFKGWVPAAVAREMAAAEKELTILRGKKGGKSYAEIVEGPKKFLKTAYWKQSPARIASNMLRYTSANFAEGAQESFQDIVSSAVKDYYTRIYEDPALAGHRQAYASFKEGIKSQLSGQGAETFLSGFFMGALIQGPQNAIYTHGRKAALKLTDREGYKKLREDREAWINTVQNSLNDIAANPQSYFRAIEQNMSSQTHLASVMSEASSKNDRKEFQDAKNDSMFHHVYTLLETGTYDHFIDQLESLKQLKPEELGEAFNEQNPGGDKDNRSIHERIDAAVSRAKDIKARYEEINRRFIDEPNPYQYDPSKEPEKYKNAVLRKVAYREAKMHAAFGNYAFDDALGRMSSIINDVTTKNKPLAKVASTDIGVIFDPFDRVNPQHGLVEKSALSKEIDDLREQIKTYEIGTREDRTRAKNLRIKAEALDSLQKNIWIYDEEFSKEREGKTPEEKTTEAAKNTINNLQKSYNRYMNVLAEQTGEKLLNQNLNSSFSGLLDFIELNRESQNMARFVNYLHDPENFLKYVDVFESELGDQLRTWKEKNKGALEKYMSRQDINLFFNLLFNKGVFINPDKVDDLIAGNYDALEFSYATTGGPVDKESDKFKNDIQPAIDVFKSLQAKEEVKPETQSGSREPIMTTEEYNHFVNTGEISDDIIRAIAEKIREGKPLSMVEQAVRSDKSAQIEDILKGTETAPTAVEPGKVIYATPGTGKTTLVKNQPDKYIDGDQLLFDYMKDNEIPVTNPQTAGLDLVKYPGYYELIPEIKQLFRDATKTGKSVLTGNWFTRDIADEVYLSKDLPRLMEELRKRGQTNVETAAKKIISQEEAAFANRAVEEIPSGATIQEVIEGLKPTVAKGAASMQKTISNLETPQAIDEFQRKINDKLDEDVMYLDRYGLNITDIIKMLNERRAEIAKQVNFATLRPGDYVVMTDKVEYGPDGVAKVVTRSTKSRTIGVRKFGDDSNPVVPIPEKSIKDMIQSKIVREAPVAPAPITEKEQEISQQNLDALSAAKDKAETRKAAIADIETADKKKIDEEFDNSLGCK